MSPGTSRHGPVASTSLLANGSEPDLSVTLSTGVPGIVQFTASKNLHFGRLVSSACYNRHLNDIVKTYGELDGLRVDFAYGRQMPTWEVGMFVALGSPGEALSIIARHFYQPLQLEANVEHNGEYQNVIDSIGLSMYRVGYHVPQLDQREHQVEIRFRTVKEVAYARIAAEYAMRWKVKRRSGLCTYATETYGLRWEPDRRGNRKGGRGPYVQITAEGWAAGGYSTHANAESERYLFERILDEYLTGRRRVPKRYYHAVLADCRDDLLTGDFESDMRVRVYLFKEGRMLLRDSSQLLDDKEVCVELHRARMLWEEQKGLRRKRDGAVSADDLDVYELVCARLMERSSDQLWTEEKERRSELDLFAASKPTRRTMSSIERLWFENLFDGADKKELGWIKRRKRYELVETRTEYYVVFPVERRVSVWTKRSLYNSLEHPWKSNLKSQITLQAVSAMCLFSACIYPDPDMNGAATVDRELFQDNVRNAGRGIGYALCKLPEEHRESQMREAATWCSYPLRLSSLLTLVWKELNWLDNVSKAWVVRETIHLLNDAGVGVRVCGVEGSFAKALYRVTEKEVLPAVIVDSALPAGGATLFEDRTGEVAISIRQGESDGKWSHRIVDRTGNRAHLGKETLAVVGTKGVENGAVLYD